MQGRCRGDMGEIACTAAPYATASSGLMLEQSAWLGLGLGLGLGFGLGLG